MSLHSTAALALALLSVGVAADLPTPSFERGEQAPNGWRLEGKGKWEQTGRTGARSVSVTGTGQDSSFWRTDADSLKPRTTYRVSFWARADRATGGCVIAGPSFCNRDFRATTNWERHSFVFVTPDLIPGDAFVRFGQWHVATRVHFDDVRLSPVQPVHERTGDLELGGGENVDGTRYVFRAPFNTEGANYARSLHAVRCGFNSNRWTFGDGSTVAYRHSLPGRAQAAATVEANCHYHVNGTGFVEASTDGTTWRTLARFEGVKRVRAALPADMLPASTVYVRLRGEKANFQISEYVYESTLDADAGRLRGGTAFLDVELSTPGITVRVFALPGGPQAHDAWDVAVRTDGADPADLVLTATVTAENGGEETARAGVTVAGGAEKPVRLPSPLRHVGESTVTLAITRVGQEVYRATARRRLAVLHDASYGALLPSDPACPLWWCEGPYKVSRTRPLPTARADRIAVALARNEFEPVQLVLRPQAALHNVRVRVGALKSANAVLDPASIRVERVAYVHVTRPTDFTGVAGWWPDPLPPFEQGRELAGGRNHPLWLTIHAPAGQPPGVYRGTIDVEADGFQATVPLEVRVWGYTLPKVSHMQTGFGLSTGTIRRYHNLETTDELRKVLDLYHRNFAEHRIAPYDPAPLDPVRVTFSTGPWEGGTIETANAREGKRCLKIVDDNTRSSVTAHNTVRMALDVKKLYLLSWRVRTEEPDQPYLVTLQQYDAEDRWLSGNNIDILRRGSGKWERQEVPIPSKGLRPVNPGTKFVRLSLRPAPYSDAGEATGTAWFDDIRFSTFRLKHQLAGEDKRGVMKAEMVPEFGPNLVADPGFEEGAEKLEAKIDFAAWDKAAQRTLGDLGFNSFRYVLRGMGGGTFHSRSPGRIGSFPQGTPEYDQLMASQGRQAVEHFKAKGWLDRAYMYWFDEPDPKDYAFVVDGMKLIRRSAPGLARMLTEQPEGALVGHVDLWCPVVHQYDPKVGFERQRAGDRFWWYLCCGPKAPYIGLFTDHPAVDLRVWAWLSRKWGIRGQLVWTTNYWTSTAAFPPPALQNPWADPMGYVSGYSYKPGQIGYWGNGDGRFLYPPNRDVVKDRRKYIEGPINSIRWEMLRDGIEDYDTFHLLDQLLAESKQSGAPAGLVAEAERLAAVPDAIITDGQTYSKDPQPLLRHRQQVGETIERLERALAARRKP